MIKGKQRAYLKSLAHNLDVMSHIGKEGITDSFLSSLEEVIEKREIVKVRILDNCGIDAKEAANEVCEAINAEFVQAIGSTFTIYKKSKNNPVITLPK
ncbi:RNA-binding protein [Acetoanaerobium pronyense]|uniref:RNA-binding protein n=1 Tax=Acetoanaerobium pronyense TaxID=1482736 RepID=A0ABS4KN70_9FIRM|nr:YhbY family RNA-binding protein [Acetoanaerobium pronyense]MBP2028084.1 RNA-binding protein [Acetoanaerobium pronyense]